MSEAARPHEPAFGAGGRQSDSGYDHKLDRPLILAEVARNARLDRRFILLIMLSAAIATLGLLQNSTAVVIGAMLVSPLLGPIMGLGFGLATIDSALIKRALITMAAGMGVAIAVSMLLILLSPIHDVTDEIAARTSPNLLDLGVAVVGGIAGVYAILRKLSGVMVGVAIATALVPPLSTVGFGLATGRPDFAGGAVLLFLTNTLAIAFAATLVARLSRFGPALTAQHTAMQVIGIIAALGLLSVPLALSLNNLVREARARNAVQSALRELIGKTDRIDTLNVQFVDGKAKVDGVLLVQRYDAALAGKVQDLAAQRLGRPVEAALVQVRQEQARSGEAISGLTERVARIEARDSQSDAILAPLTAPGLLDRQSVAVDPQSRLIAIRRDRAAEGTERAAAIDAATQKLRVDTPAWQVIEQDAAPAR